MNETKLKTVPQSADAKSLALGRRLALLLALLSLAPLLWTAWLVTTCPSPRSEFLTAATEVEQLKATESVDATRALLLEKASEMARDLQLQSELKTFEEDWYFEFIREQIGDEQDATQFADLQDKLSIAYGRQFELHRTMTLYGLAVSLICFVLALVMWLKPWAPLSLFLLAATLSGTPPVMEFFIGRDPGLTGVLWSLPAISLAVGIVFVVIRNLKFWRQREMHPWQAALLGSALIGVGVIWVSLTYHLPSRDVAVPKFGIDPHPSHAGLVMIIGGVMLAGLGIFNFCAEFCSRANDRKQEASGADQTTERTQLVFWEGGNMAAKVFVSLFALLLGTMGLFGAFDRMGPHFDSDAVFLLLFGAVLFGISLLEIDDISTRKEKLKPHKRTPGPPLVIEWIVLHLRNGSDEKFIAPSVIGNDQLLDLLSWKTNKQVNRDTRTDAEIPIGK